MATLAKSATGLLIHDNMDFLNSYWAITPQTGDRVVVSARGDVELEHGDVRASMLISAPTGDYVFQTEISHVPSSLADVGGVLIYADSINQIELQSYFSGTAGLNQFYKSIKVIKEGDRFEFHATKDNEIWEIVGKSLLQDAHMIGFFLDGPKTETSQRLTVKNAAFYRSNFVCFVGIPSSYTIKVYDRTMNEKLTIRAIDYPLGETGGKMLVDLSRKLLPIMDATIRILDGEVVVHEKFVESFCGGDTYDFTYNIGVMINDVLIDEIVDYDFGYVGSGGQINKLSVLNKDDSPLQNKKIKVTAFSEYYRGGKFAKLAFVDSNGVEMSSYSEELIMPEIPAGGRLDMALKIERDASTEAPFFNKEYRFKVLIE